MPAMVSEATLKSLHPLEIKTLLHYDGTAEFGAAQMERDLGLKLGQCNQALSWLVAKSYLDETRREEHVFYERTELGAEFAEKGTPVERIIRAVTDRGPMTLPELADATGLEKKDVGSSYGQLSKKGILTMDGDKKVSFPADGSQGAEALPESEQVLNRLLNSAADGDLVDARLTPEERDVVAANAKKRGASSAMFRIVEREVVFYRINPLGVEVKDALARAGMSGDEVGRLTPEMLRDGSWRGRSFREYGVNAPTSRLIPGRRNPYCEYLDSVKDKLVSLGFEEFDGPMVETEFWNSDALFMPQFHSARDIHDVYYVKDPSHAREIEEPYLSRIAGTHEDGWETGSRGWGYRFDRDFTPPAHSAQSGNGHVRQNAAQGEDSRKNTSEFCGGFRYDQVDATHLSDFYQTEGIVLGEEVNLKKPSRPPGNVCR